MVSPDCHLLDLCHFGTSLESELSESSVVIKSCHGSEVLYWKIFGVILANERVGVGWVSNDNGLCVTSAVVVDSLTNIDKDLSVVLEQVSALHTWTTRLGTDQEVVVDILEGSGQIAGDDDLVEKREGAVMELSLDTLEDLLLEWKIEQVKNDSLVLAKEFTATKKSAR